MASQHEAQLLQILADTQSSADGPRRQAEIYLKSAQAEPAFPSMLASIASHSTVPSELRQAALLNLKNFTSKNWTGHDDNGNPTIQIAEGTKAEIRARMLKIATDDVDSRKIKSAARCVEVLFLACSLLLVILMEGHVDFMKSAFANLRFNE